MRAYIKTNAALLSFVTFFMLISQILYSWFSVGYYLYESQNRILPPQFYRAEVISLEDYTKLSDRSLETIQLSNGTTVSNRQETFYDHLYPNYALVGNHYVLITTKGTGHYSQVWFHQSSQLLLLAVAGCYFAFINFSTSAKNKSKS